MPEIRIGCGPFPTRRKGYFDRFGFVELSEMYFEPVRHNTLTGWRNNHDEEAFEFVPVAWKWLSVDPLDIDEPLPFEAPTRDFGLLQDTEANARVWSEVRAMCEAISARRLLLKTPASFSPSATCRSALERFVTQQAREAGLTVIWEPRGIWTREELHAIGADLGMVIAADPFGEDDFPPVPDGDAWYVLTGPRGRRDFSEDDLLDLYDFLTDHPGRVDLVFRGADRDRNAEAMRSVVLRESGGA